MKGILRCIRTTKVEILDYYGIITNTDMLHEVSKNTKYSHYPLMTTTNSSQCLMQRPNKMSLAGNTKLQPLIGLCLYSNLSSQNILHLWDKYSAMKQAGEAEITK